MCINRSGHGGDPGRVNQRKRQHLGEDRGIVRMPDVAKWSGGHDAEARRIITWTFQCSPRVPNHPPATALQRETRQTSLRELRNKRAPQKTTSKSGTASTAVCIKTIQRIAVRRPSPLRAQPSPAGGAWKCATPRAAAEPRRGATPREERDHTQVHCSSRNSALKPGPERRCHRVFHLV